MFTRGQMQEALFAAQTAAEEQNKKLGDERERGFDCGFAWVYMSGNEPFTRWVKKEFPDMLNNGYPRGKQIWYSQLHSLPTQSISVHEAACKAFRDYWATRGVRLDIASRLD